MRSSGSGCVALACLTIGCLEAPPGADVAGAPSAAFTSQASFLEVAFDASGSSDPDGVIDSYAWTFGDGASATGVDQVHAYDAAGTYGVKLVVTDDEGKTDAIANEVTVEEAAAPFAVDGFERVIEDAWGFADVGGLWSVDMDAAFAVDGAAGTISVPMGEERNALLTTVDSVAYEVSYVFTSVEAPTGGGLHVRAVGRQVGDYSYLLSVVIAADGVVDARLEVSVVGQNGNILDGALVLPGVTYEPGDVLAVRFQVEGTAPTQLRAKVWPIAQDEPNDWQFEAADETAVLQEAGAIGVASYLSASATTTPVTVTIDDFLARPLE
ncbi:MAG TPA: PKD domain-containing protein [Kofleriaceae bacterium]|nr:PKD domain-containing protein [Kofleriaceae bacterium]